MKSIPSLPSVEQIIEVLLPLPFDHGFDYEVPSSLSLRPGEWVQVPFGTRQLYGIVWREVPLDEQKKDLKRKAVTARLDMPALSEAHLRFLEWVAHYTLSPLGAVFKLTLSVPTVFKPVRSVKKSKDREEDKIQEKRTAPVVFSQEQRQAAQALVRQVEKEKFSVTLLEGVTGSGKTEVYFEAITHVVQQGKQVVILLPEIALTPQLEARFRNRFGTPPLLWHSDLTPAQRRNRWLEISQTQDPKHGQVIIGARSALFLPYPNLGLLIVDEEHEQAYKQEEGVIYQARDMAVVRAHLAQLPCILVSATPSLETLLNCEKGRYAHIRLKHRYAEAQMPEIHVIPMKEERKNQRAAQKKEDKKPQEPQWIATELRKNIEEALGAGEQSLLFLNRRGYAPLTLCESCGEKLQCPSCTVWLVEHRWDHHLLCHHCGYRVKRPRHCPKCHQEDSLIPCGPGVERVEEEVRQLFPRAKTLVMASDRIQGTEALQRAIQHISDREVDIIIGTQMMAKGHHFPYLTLVGVIDADLGLSGGDLRACERTYQLLHQVSGRSGRGERPGRVFLQTYYPDHPVMQALASGDEERFFAEELEMRKTFHMPPFGRLVALIVSGYQGTQVESFARTLVNRAPAIEGVEVLGPAPAPLSIIRKRHRWRILVHAPRNFRIQDYVRHWLQALKVPSSLKLQIDVDPYSFL